MEEAAYLVEGRPPGGWDGLATKDDLVALEGRMELRLAATAHELRAEFRDQTTRLVKWFVPTVFAGMSVSSALIAGAFAALA